MQSRPGRYGAGLLVVAATLGCGRADAVPPSAPGPTAPTTTVAPATVPADVTARVARAYRRAWRVYARAVETPSAEGLGRAWADSALLLKRREVADLIRTGRAVSVRVEHRPRISMVGPDTALVTDAYRNHMRYVDAVTRRPLEPDPDETVVRAYTLRRRDGTWKVTEVVAL